MVTTEHIRAAIEICTCGGTTEHPYDQASWCGTACCVGGHARLLAGEPLEEGPPDVPDDDPEAGTLRQLMFCKSPDVLRVMRAVDEDGQINLRGADLRKCNLSGADLSGADLRDCNLSGADLRDCNLSGADLSDADMSGADLSGAYLCGADLRKCDLSGADLSGADLYDCNLSGAWLDDE